MSVDLNFLRGISTVFVMIGFFAVTFWAYSSRRRDEFEQAAQLPFADDDVNQPSGDKPRE